MQIKKFTLFIGLLWMLLITISCAWHYIQSQKEEQRLARQTARTLFNHFVSTYHWSIMHDSVYVPVTETTGPSPGRDEPLQEIKVDDTLTLTRINHACMIRQIAEITMKQHGVQFHISSRHPIRPENKATQREEALLKTFERGAADAGFFINDKGKKSFYYIAPLKAEKPCLSCHDKYDSQEGEVLGGISLTLPITPPKGSLAPLLLIHIAIALAGLLGIFISGVRLNRAYSTIARQAMFDSLTGIPNRQNFSEHMVREFSRSNRAKEPLAVIMCDIDQFKAYNDTYGHTSGDECLKKVAQTIEQTLERPGDFCARYGGEEFVVILADTSQKGAMHVAERIRLKILELKILHEKSLPLQVVSLSLGVATSTDQPLKSHEELLKNADTALYAAKYKGRNRVESYVKISDKPES